MDEHDPTSQAVEALLFLSSDPDIATVPRRADRTVKAHSARQSDNGHEGRPLKKSRTTKGRAAEVKHEAPPASAAAFAAARDAARSTSSASEGNPLISPASASTRALSQIGASGRAAALSGNPAHRQTVKVAGIQHEVSALLLERAAMEPQLLSFRRTGKSLNLCMLYNGQPYAGYFALNTKANEELNADSSSRSSNGSQAAVAGVEEEPEVGVEVEAEGGGRGRRRRTAHNYAQLADGSATPLTASRPSQDLEGKERIARQKEIDSQQEWLRMQLEGPAAGAVCALCHGPEDICRTMEGGPAHATLPRHLGKLVLARPSLKRMPCWVHEQCALWSADLYHSDAQSRPLIASLGAALRRGLGIACSACHRKGATVSCVYPLCKKVFHVGCAVSSHCHMDPNARWCTACPEHYAHAHHTLNARLTQGMLPEGPVTDRARKSMRRAASTMDKLQRKPAHSDQSGRNIMSDPGFAMPPLFMNPGNPFGMPGMMMGNLGGMSNMMQSMRMRMPPMMPGLDTLSQQHAAQMAAFGRMPAMSMGFDPMGDVQGSSWLASSMFQDSMHSSPLEDMHEDDGIASGNRCAVCRVQRKGRCGTLSASRSCLKRKALEHAGLPVPPGPPKATRPRSDAE